MIIRKREEDMLKIDTFLNDCDEGIEIILELLVSIHTSLISEHKCYINSK